MRPSISEPAELPSRYRMISQLGRGAFAAAYRCEDTEGGGEVVVKLYELREAAWSLLTSFEREAAVLAQLSHVAIPQYLAHAQLPDGRLMLVQSYAQGRSLGDLLREGRRFTDAEVADLTEQVLAVLEYLQSLNPPIIHRDIKPANLVLNDARRVQLVDFGSVKEGFRRNADLASTIAGTYGYMAPEQFQGRATIQSDLYGLGATLVHVLSHVAPSELPQEGLKLAFRDSVKASAGTIDWLDRMLEPDPRQRFADAAQARAAFRRRDSAAVSPTLAVAASATTTAPADVDPPRGSRITVEESAGTLNLTIPGSGFRGPALGIFGFASFWLIFIAVWTGGAMQGSFLFAMFSIPFWIVGVFMMSQALSAMFGTTTIDLGPKLYLVQKRLWGQVRRYEGLTADLGGANLVRSGNSRNGQQIAQCVLYTGAKDIKFGAQLGQMERRWLVDRVNHHLGTDPESLDEAD